MLYNKAKIFIGLNDKTSKIQEIPTHKAIEIIAEKFDECTIYQGYGTFRHEDGKRVFEKSIILEKICFEEKDVRNIYRAISDLRVDLNQEAIIAEWSKVKSDYIDENFFNRKR